MDSFSNIILTVSGLCFFTYMIFHFFGQNRMTFLFQIITCLLLFPMTFQRLYIVNFIKEGFLGMFLGVVVFCISFFCTTCHPLDNFKLFLQNIFSTTITEEFKRNVFIQGATACWEELFWRICIQGVLVHFFTPFIAIISTACLFWSVHTHQFKTSIPRMSEMFLFSILLGGLFEIFQSLILCTVIHFVRNILIVSYRIHVVSNKKMI